MSNKVHLDTPLNEEDVAKLSIGDNVYLSGKVYTARDMTHIRIVEYLTEGKKLLDDFNGAAVFHAGPVVRRSKGKWKVEVIGPTSSIRMEPFSEIMFGKLGVRALIGKGGMGEQTQDVLAKYCGVYLVSPPGCGAIQAKSVREVLAVRWLDLGMPEALWVLDAKDWGPLSVGIDSKGRSVFKEIKEKALEKINEIVERKTGGRIA